MFNILPYFLPILNMAYYLRKQILTRTQRLKLEDYHKAAYIPQSELHQNLLYHNSFRKLSCLQFVRPAFD